MRLATALHDGRTVFGPVVDGRLHDVSATGLWPDLAAALPLAERETLAGAADGAPALDVDQLRWLPPVPHPERILCIGLNYPAHVAESDHPTAITGQHPAVFTRFPSSFVGHEGELVRPAESAAYDFEGELAVVIGQVARSVPVERAYDVVAGYTCLMDGSVRDFQRHSSQFIPGKNFDASGSFGPWIVTADVLDLGAVQLTTRLNGTVVQDSPVSAMTFKVDQLIAYCSSFTTLQPGDVIATGTPGGVGFSRTPPLFLEAGDVLEVELSGIGLLRNPVIDEA